MDPEAQTRGFLQVFQSTPVFQDAFQKLSPMMKKQVHGFVAGRSASDVVGSAEFRVPLSPQTQHHIAPLDQFRAGMRRPRRDDLPVIYEDKAQLMAMEVSSPPKYFFFYRATRVILHDNSDPARRLTYARCMRISSSRTGDSQSKILPATHLSRVRSWAFKI
jgi:hypothetical protein